MHDLEKIRDGTSIAAMIVSGLVLLAGAAVAAFLTGYCDGTCNRQWDPLVALLALPLFGGGVALLTVAVHLLMPGQSAFARGMPASTQSLRGSFDVALGAGLLLEGVLAVGYALAETGTISGDSAWLGFWIVSLGAWTAATVRLVRRAQRVL